MTIPIAKSFFSTGLDTWIEEKWDTSLVSGELLVELFFAEDELEDFEGMLVGVFWFDELELDIDGTFALPVLKMCSSKESLSSLSLWKLPTSSWTSSSSILPVISF